MVHSRLPLLSLLVLFGPLLVLSLELPLFLPKDLSDLPLTHPGVKEAITLATDTYNQRRKKERNYFKVLDVLKAQSQVSRRDEYHLMMILVETKCKHHSWDVVSESELAQKCELLPGNDKKKKCYFKVILRTPKNVAVTACT